MTRTPFGIGWRIYQQIAAVIAAFALLSFLINFVDVEWRSWLATLISVWDEVVRPPVQRLLHYALEVPLSWIGWDIEVPQWLRDYVAVGVILVASHLRALVGAGSLRTALSAMLSVRRWVREYGLLALLIWPPIEVIAWPASLAALTIYGGRLVAKRQERDWTEFWNVVAILSPLIYASILLALNALVL
jgi:hypothetical protein